MIEGIDLQVVWFKKVLICVSIYYSSFDERSFFSVLGYIMVKDKRNVEERKAHKGEKIGRWKEARMVQAVKRYVLNGSLLKFLSKYKYFLNITYIQVNIFVWFYFVILNIVLVTTINRNLGIEEKFYP